MYLGVALVQQHAVNTLRVRPARAVVRRLTVAPWDLRQVSHDYLHLSYWPVHLMQRGREGGVTMTTAHIDSSVTMTTAHIDYSSH